MLQLVRRDQEGSVRKELAQGPNFTGDSGWYAPPAVDGVVRYVRWIVMYNLWGEGVANLSLNDGFAFDVLIRLDIQGLCVIHRVCEKELHLLSVRHVY